MRPYSTCFQMYQGHHVDPKTKQLTIFSPHFASVSWNHTYIAKNSRGPWPTGINFSLNIGYYLGYDYKGQLYITLKTNLQRNAAVVSEKLEFLLKAITVLTLAFSANTVWRQYAIPRPAESIFSFSCFCFIYLLLPFFFSQFFYKSSGKALDHKHTCGRSMLRWLVGPGCQPCCQ